MQVQIVVNEQKTFTLFLTNRNYLIDYSSKVDCARINERVMVNKTHFVVRIGNKNKIVGVADLKYVDLTHQNFDFAEMNFNHNQEIIDGYDAISEYHDSMESADDDIDKHFHILPDDDVVDRRSGFSEWTHHALDTLHNAWTWFIDCLKSLLFKCLLILSLVGIFMIIYLVMKSKLSKPLPLLL